MSAWSPESDLVFPASVLAPEPALELPRPDEPLEDTAPEEAPDEDEPPDEGAPADGEGFYVAETLRFGTRKAGAPECASYAARPFFFACVTDFASASSTAVTRSGPGGFCQ